MYMAKEAGRNQFSFFTSELAVNSANYLALEASLRKAIVGQELVLRYQPQYRLEDGALIGLEALVRWPMAEPFTVISIPFPVWVSTCPLMISSRDTSMQNPC